MALVVGHSAQNMALQRPEPKNGTSSIPHCFTSVVLRSVEQKSVTKGELVKEEENWLVDFYLCSVGFDLQVDGGARQSKIYGTAPR